MKNVLIVVSLAILMVLFTASAVFAAGETIRKEYTFTSKTPEFTYSAAETITDNGNKYKLQDIDYQQIDEKDLYISKTATYTNLTEKKVPLERVFTIDGKDQTLQADAEDIQYSEQSETVTEKRNGYTTAPAFPDTKTVRKNGKACKGKLVGVVEQKTSKPLTATAKFTGAKGTDYYLNGQKITIKGNGPAWSGSEKAIVEYMKLPEGSRVTGGRWTSGYQKEKGEMVRYATFTVTRPAANYTATYRYTRYNATVKYDNQKRPDEKEYTVKAICSYRIASEPPKEEPKEKAGMSLLQKLLCVGAGILVLAIVLSTILAILRHRKKEEEDE